MKREDSVRMRQDSVMKDNMIITNITEDDEDADDRGYDYEDHGFNSDVVTVLSENIRRFNVRHDNVGENV
jgi:hypothetical protein